MSYNLEYIERKAIPPEIAGNDETTETTFRCERFLYYAKCFQGILQSVGGESPQSYLNWEIPPTEQEIEQHDERRKDFNQNHSIIQQWIDSLG